MSDQVCSECGQDFEELDEESFSDNDEPVCSECFYSESDSDA